jgi:hypothetical protein
MSKRINSNNPFKGKNNIRAGAGPVYNKFKPTPTILNNGSRSTTPPQSPCFGEYDNTVNYVWEIDLTNGNHLAYVDCDYVS